MDSLFENFGGCQIILLPLAIVFIVSLRRSLNRDVDWTFKSVLFDVFGFVGTIVAFFSSMALLFDRMSPAGTGSFGTWFLIYAVMSLGLVPLLFIFVFYSSGRFIGRMMWLWRIRTTGKTLSSLHLNGEHPSKPM